MKYGIAINLHQLNSFEMSKNKNTVTVGGGINSHNLTSALWAAGKQTVTGTCECVSYLVSVSMKLFYNTKSLIKAG
jgi:phosphoribosylformimino-5-aminoimidazole carboxamide ribonucleotide (ProFAR) isomerase